MPRQSSKKKAVTPASDRRKIERIFLEAIRLENMDIMDECIAAYPGVIYARYEQGFNRALWSRKEDMALKLLHLGCGDRNFSTLRRAAWNGNMKVFDALLDMGIPVSGVHMGTIKDIFMSLITLSEGSQVQRFLKYIEGTSQYKKLLHDKDYFIDRALDSRRYIHYNENITRTINNIKMCFKKEFDSNIDILISRTLMKLDAEEKRRYFNDDLIEKTKKLYNLLLQEKARIREETTG
jgi:hypothetical protein